MSVRLARYLALVLAALCCGRALADSGAPASDPSHPRSLGAACPDLPRAVLRPAGDLPAAGGFRSPAVSGPVVQPIAESTITGLRDARPWLLHYDGGRILGAPVAEIPPGAYRLGGWWLYRDATSIQRAERYPETIEDARRALLRLGIQPTAHEVERYLAAGVELNRDIDAYLVTHRLSLEDAIARTRRLHIDLLRQLVAAYAQAFAVAASNLALAHGVGATPEEMEAQARARRSAGRPGPRGRSAGDEPVEVLPSGVRPQKPTPTPAAVERWASGFDRKPTPTRTAANQYEIRHTGPENIRVRAGGAQIDADGIRASDGFLLDAKFIDYPERSPYVPGSSFPESIRGPMKQLQEEFKRYGLVIQDPSTPVVGLEVITNHPGAARLFLDIIRQLGIPGRVVVRQ